MSKETKHQSVLLQEVIDGLNPLPGEVVVDCTINGAGHSLGMLQKTKGKITLIGIDADEMAVERAKNRIQDAGFTAAIFHQNFRNIDEVLREAGIAKIHKCLFDLGWSSDQLESGKGLSFLKNEPLNMSFGKSGKDHSFTARDIVNDWDEENIIAILVGYGEERYAKAIARGITHARESKAIETTEELVRIIKDSTPSRYHYGKIHPATRTFQALRIAVNDELGAVETALKKTYDVLHAKGRIAVITFHSIEDRIVKWIFKGWVAKDLGTSLSKKPITASDEEVSSNPRSRSAKLRIFEKNNENGSFTT